MTILKLKYLKPTDLQDHERNSRTHTPAQIAKIEASLKEFGFLNPAIVQGNTIVAGHARVAAAKAIGLKAIPTLDVSHLTEAQVRAWLGATR